MSKKILTFDNFAQAFEAVAPLLGEGLGKKYYVIAPDKYTLRLEKMLFSRRGSFCAEVTSFPRLYYKVCGELAAVSREGGIMILKSVLSGLRLNYYNKSKNYNGFAAKMYDTVKTLMDAGIPPQALDTQKLSDIALVYESYLKEIDGKYVDTIGIMKALSKSADYFAGSEVVVVGFNGYSAGELELIDRIAEFASVTVLDRSDKSFVPKNPVAIYAASGVADSLKAAAKALRNAFLSGILPEETAVISPPTAYERIKRIFAEYEIPFYIDSKKKLSEYPSGNFFCAFYQAEKSNYASADILSLAKNPYSGLSKEESDCLEIYLDAYGVERKSFFEEFRIDCGVRQIAEGARRRLTSLIGEVRLLLESPGFKEGVEGIADRLRMRTGAGDGNFGSNALPVEPESNLDKIFELCEIIDRTGITENRLGLLSEGIRSTDISRLPAFTGSVTVGEPSAFRGTRPSLLVILGCNEGQIPSYLSEGGILNDGDVEYLNRERRLLSERRETNDKEERELLELISLSKDTLAIYDAVAETKKSDFLYLLSPKKAVALMPVDRLLYDCCSESASLERLIVGVAAFRAGGEYSEEDGAIYHAVKDKASEYVSLAATFDCGSEGQRMIERGTYISQLQTFFDCPAKHFFRYGLRLRGRETAELTAVDVGNVMHRIVELVISKGDFEDITASVESAATLAISEGIKYALEKNSWLMDNIKQESEKVIRIFLSHLRKGSFGNIMTEAEFGGRSGLKGIELASQPPVTLRGKIDMMDFCGNAVRIIDYKTGYAKFSAADIYYGKKLQLPLYMAAAEQNGFMGVGMFYFPLKSSWKDDGLSHRLSGVFRGGLDTAILMDGSLIDGAESEVVSVRTKGEGESLRMYATASSLSDEGFAAIVEYSLRLAAYGVEKIRMGYCAPSPLKGRSDPCSYCEYFYSCPGASYRGKGRVTVETLLNALKN